MGWKMAGENGADEVAGESPDATAPTTKKKGDKGDKGKRKRKRKLPVVVAVLVVIFIISRIGSCGGAKSEKAKTLVWPTSGLATLLPDPPTNRGEVHTNRDDYLDADINECSEEQYAQYVEACKGKGFTIDASSDTGDYDAFSADGSRLHLTYYSSWNEISVSLSAPIEMGAISWPTTGPASYVPAPASATGKIDSDSSKFFYAYVGETDAAAYGAYVDACIAAGYNVDYHKGSKSFYADNANGVHLSVEYRGFNTMTVRIDTSKMTADAPAAEASAPEPEPEAQPQQTTASSSSVREALDAYEAFMNEYCDFMEEYQAEGRPATMLAKYGEMMTKYADMAAKFDAIDEGSLSAEDDAYYIDVQARVSKRLLAVAAQ